MVRSTLTTSSVGCPPANVIGSSGTTGAPSTPLTNSGATGSFKTSFVCGTCGLWPMLIPTSQNERNRLGKVRGSSSCRRMRRSQGGQSAGTALVEPSRRAPHDSPCPDRRPASDAFDALVSALAHVSEQPWDAMPMHAAEPEFRQTVFGGLGLVSFYVDDTAEILRVFDITWTGSRPRSQCAESNPPSFTTCATSTRQRFSWRASASTWWRRGSGTLTHPSRSGSTPT